MVKNRVSAFYLPTDTPGYRVVERVSCLGLEGGDQEEELEFKDCRIPEEI